jgi:hypothetical protein
MKIIAILKLILKIAIIFSNSWINLHRFLTFWALIYIFEKISNIFHDIQSFA